VTNFGVFFNKNSFLEDFFPEKQGICDKISFFTKYCSQNGEILPPKKNQKKKSLILP